MRFEKFGEKRMIMILYMRKTGNNWTFRRMIEQWYHWWSDDSWIEEGGFSSFRGGCLSTFHGGPDKEGIRVLTSIYDDAAEIARSHSWEEIKAMRAEAADSEIPYDLQKRARKLGYIIRGDYSEKQPLRLTSRYNVLDTQGQIICQSKTMEQIEEFVKTSENMEVK